ncbi:MAG: hypothetical protein ABI415_09510 [Flavitalea sp.]
MKNSFLSPWYVKLMILILCVVGAFLVVMAFKDGYQDALRAKASMRAGQHPASK